VAIVGGVGVKATTGICRPSWPAVGDRVGDVVVQLADELVLAAVPRSAAYARRFARCVLSQWGIAYLMETAELLVTELVANAVGASSGTAAAGGAHIIQVRLTLAGGLYISVWDCNETPPALQEPSLGAESGRGLFLVDCMSKEWGYSRSTGIGGKIVWCELDNVPPTTKSGLPMRTPGVVPARQMEMLIDLVVLRRVVEGLRQLQ
jgi:hypothetical protein